VHLFAGLNGATDRHGPSIDLTETGLFYDPLEKRQVCISDDYPDRGACAARTVVATIHDHDRAFAVDYGRQIGSVGRREI